MSVIKSERINIRNGAQGVMVWDRLIGETWYRFSWIYEGWWGVGPTGTVRVSKPNSVYDRYEVHCITFA